MQRFYKDLGKTQLKVGIFTIVIALLLLLGYLWLTNRLDMRARQDLRVSFEDIAGLEVGDKVMFRGMEIGRVSSVRSSEERILVEARISHEIKLREGSRFLISDSSLMGGTAMNITPGNGDGFLSLNKIQQGDPPSGIMNMMGKASGAVDELETLLSKLREEGSLLDKSSSLLDDADAAVKTAGTVAERMGSDLKATLDSIDRLSASLNRIVTDNSGNVDRLLESTPGTVLNINATLDSLRDLSGKLGQTVTGISSGKGTAGRLVTDDELYKRVLESVNNLDALVQDIKAHPKKYVKFSLF
jgi:phospholipid/cholesterol/gamma-HCH transport system substrate-binding protein